jgi:hypothetical protein
MAFVGARRYPAPIELPCQVWAIVPVVLTTSEAKTRATIDRLPVTSVVAQKEVGTYTVRLQFIQ